MAARAVHAHRDEPGVAKHSQVLRHRRLGDAELTLHDRRDLTRGHLVGDEELEDAAAHRVAEDVEGVHHPPVYAAVVRAAASSACGRGVP